MADDQPPQPTGQRPVPPIPVRRIAGGAQTGLLALAMMSVGVAFFGGLLFAAPVSAAATETPDACNLSLSDDRDKVSLRIFDTDPRYAPLSAPTICTTQGRVR